LIDLLTCGCISLIYTHSYSARNDYNHVHQHATNVCFHTGPPQHNLSSQRTPIQFNDISINHMSFTRLIINSLSYIHNNLSRSHHNLTQAHRNLSKVHHKLAKSHSKLTHVHHKPPHAYHSSRHTTHVTKTSQTATTTSHRHTHFQHCTLQLEPRSS